MADRQRRRTLAAILLIGAAALGANRWLNRPPAPRFEPVDGLPPFRRAETGSVSGGFDPFIGLDNRAPPPPLPAAQVCRTLFRDTRPGTVPVASFSDYNCPYCRILTPALADRHERGDITVTWHELPLLGPTSEIAARGAVAADFQGAYAPFHARLMRSRVVATPEFLAEIARSAGIDAPRLVRDAASPRVDARLDEARALAGWFGFYGTPALVVGRSAVIGSLDLGRLDRLIADEAEVGFNCG